MCQILLLAACGYQCSYCVPERKRGELGWFGGAGGCFGRSSEVAGWQRRLLCNFIQLFETNYLLHRLGLELYKRFRLKCRRLHIYIYIYIETDAQIWNLTVQRTFSLSLSLVSQPSLNTISLSV